MIRTKAVFSLFAYLLIDTWTGTNVFTVPSFLSFSLILSSRSLLARGPNSCVLGKVHYITWNERRLQTKFTFFPILNPLAHISCGIHILSYHMACVSDG